MTDEIKQGKYSELLKGKTVVMQYDKEELLKRFEIFTSENPLDFDLDEFAKVKEDITNKRNGIVSDEYIDFMLWNKGAKTRQECFAEFVAALFPKQRYNKLLEVGSGRKARLGKLLVKAGYDLTAMEPRFNADKVMLDGVKCIKSFFDYKTIDITGYDAVVAQEPCEATEHIVRACIQKRKNFVISLCGVPHNLIDGTEVRDALEWYDYLKNIDSDSCMLIQPKLIEGYVSNILIGFFRK